MQNKLKNLLSLFAFGLCFLGGCSGKEGVAADDAVPQPSGGTNAISGGSAKTAEPAQMAPIPPPPPGR